MSRRTCLIIAIICLALLAAALLIAHNSPATGYELSIYASTPVLVWVFLMLACAGGVFLILHEVITEPSERSRFWLIGFLILLLAHVSILYVPYIRGYVSWLGDNISHWGYVKDIVNTGHFTKDDPYPITHILLTQVLSVTGLPLSTVTNLSTCFLSVGFVLSTYLLATAVLPHKGQHLLAAALAAAVMPFVGYHVLLMPNGWSILLFPFLLFAVFKCDGWAYLVLALVLVVLYPFFHPLSSLMVAAAFVATVLLLSFGVRYVSRSARRTRSKLVLGRILTLAGIELAILLPWVMSFQRFHANLRLLWENLTTGGGENVIGGMGESLNKVNVHGLGFLLLLTKMYGVSLFLIGTAAIGGFLVIRRLRSGASDAKYLCLLSLLVLMLLFGSLYLLYYVGAPGLGTIGGERLLSYVLIPTVVLSGFALYHLVARFGRGLRVAAAVLCTIMLAAVLSMLTLYDSPYRLRPNLQITQMDMTGMGWLVDTKDRSLGTTYILINVDRFADGLLGTNEARQREDLSSNAPVIADHFGYGDYATLGEQYLEDTYSAITAADTIVYDTVWKEVGRFSRDDFEQLQEDATVNKLYSNGGLSVYLIRSVERPLPLGDGV